MKLMLNIILLALSSNLYGGVVGTNLPTLSAGTGGGNNSPTYRDIDWKPAWSGYLHDRTLSLNIPSTAALRVNAKSCYKYNPVSKTTCHGPSWTTSYPGTIKNHFGEFLCPNLSTTDVRVGFYCFKVVRTRSNLIQLQPGWNFGTCFGPSGGCENHKVGYVGVNWTPYSNWFLYGVEYLDL